MIRILVVDDHPVVREGLVAVLGDQADFEVVGSAGSAEEGLPLARRELPEVALLDLELPGLDGVGAISQFAEAVPGVSVIVLTAYGTDERVFGALRAGARGYLLKGAPVEEIARAIRVVHGGGSYLEAQVAAKVMSEFSGHRRRGSLLTERERQVLRQVRDGLSNKQIARALGISERTVKFHLNSVFTKLDVENRARAVAVGLEEGLL
jgi:DNA-binding NarL/FixJ family response regulator